MSHLSPKVSIVIPTYNQPEYILRAVNSALMQDYPHLEVIVSDDSSNSNTQDVLEPLFQNNKLFYYRNNPRLGRVLNYRTCLYDYAKGDWVLNLDGDDYLTNNTFISSALKLIENSDDIVFVQAGGLVMNSDNVVLQTKMPNPKNNNCIQTGWKYMINFAFKRNFLHLTTLYNAKKAKEIDFYRYPGLSSDLESFMRLALHGSVGLLNMNAGVWFHHNNNTSNNANEVTIIENTEWVQSVKEYAIKKGLISNISISLWTYVVRNQELTGAFIRRLYLADSKITRRNYLLMVLRKYPTTFMFPVFQKKIIQFILKGYLFFLSFVC